MGNRFCRISTAARVIDRPDLELVGLYLYGQSKVDIDAGVLAGRPPTGIAATDDASATLELVDTIRYPSNRVSKNRTMPRPGRTLASRIRQTNPEDKRAAAIGVVLHTSRATPRPAGSMRRARLLRRSAAQRRLGSSSAGVKSGSRRRYSA